MRRTTPSLVFFLLSAIFGLAGSSASAAVKNRIAAAVSDADRTTIPNSVSPKAKLATDLGPAPGTTKLQGMTLRFNMTAAQQAALDQLLLNQQNPSSPQYHQWLTPAQYGAQFGLSSADIAKITAWLTGEGFTVTGVANSSTFVTFDGTVAQANAAFAANIHNVSLHGETHFANLSDPTLPSALASVVMGVTGLHDFRHKPRIKARTVKPEYTSGGSHYMAPGDFYQIYNEVPLLTAATPITGAGVNVAIMGQVNLVLTDVSAFRAAAGLLAAAPTLLSPCSPSNLTGCPPSATNQCSAYSSRYCPQPNLDDLGESDLDVEWSGSSAPGATIIFVSGADVFNNATTQAIDDNVAPIVSVSYGDCEPSWGTAELNTLNQLFKQANAQGQTVVAPAADYGATDCDNSDSSAVEGLAVDFPASSPYVTAMGGTMFNEGSGSYWSASQNTLTAGSAVPGAPYSALTYIPEAAWNDASGDYFGGGGGGPSEYFTKPYWQTGTGVPADASRDVPDLAFNSSDLHDSLLYCSDGSCAGGFAGAITNGSYAGGTSFATPTFAGVLALVEQKTGGRLGNANPTIYSLAANSKFYLSGTTFSGNSSVVFNDVITGNNMMACTAGTPYCPSGGSIGYSAGNAYDLATGWGSVNTSNFVNAWSQVTPIPVSGPTGTNTSLTTVAASSGSAAAGATVTLTATVTSGTAGVTATPTGTVQFLINNSAVGAAATLNSSGAATYSYVTSCSTLGQQIITASYSGDANYAGSKGAGLASGEAGSTGGLQENSYGEAEVTPIELQVSSGSCPSFSIAGPSSSVSVASNGTPLATITVAPVNGFTGLVTFTASAVSNTDLAPGFAFSPASVTISSTASASTTLTLSGITASLDRPARPGSRNSGTALASGKPHSAPWYLGGSGVTIASLLLFALPRRRRLGGLLLVALAVALTGAASGCSSGNSSIAAGNTSNYAGTYLVTVTATSSGSSVVSQTTTVTFVVQ